MKDILWEITETYCNRMGIGDNIKYKEFIAKIKLGSVAITFAKGVL